MAEISRTQTDTFLDYLKKNFGEDYPIFIEKIRFNGYTQTQVLDMVAALYEQGELEKFDEDVYYIPTDTCLGKSVLSIKQVIEMKYIRDGADVYGFYGGVAIQNHLGLSTQVAATLEIYTNKETAEERKVQVRRHNVILRRGRTYITADNAATLTFLEVVTDSPEWWFRDKDEETEEKMKFLTEYINGTKITEQSVNEYLPLFPEDTAKKIKEGGLTFYAA